MRTRRIITSILIVATLGTFGMVLRNGWAIQDDFDSPATTQ